MSSETRSSNPIDSDYGYNITMASGLIPTILAIVGVLIILLVSVVGGCLSSSTTKGSSTSTSLTRSYPFNLGLVIGIPFLYSAIVSVFIILSAFEILHVAACIVISWLVFIVLQWVTCYFFGRVRYFSSLDKRQEDKRVKDREEGSAAGEEGMKDPQFSDIQQGGSPTTKKKEESSTKSGSSTLREPRLLTAPWEPAGNMCCCIPCTSIFAIVSTICFVLTYGVCFCSQPYELTTLHVGRGSGVRGSLCEDDQVCYTYFTLGSNCTSTTLVAHVKVSPSNLENFPKDSRSLFEQDGSTTTAAAFISAEVYLHGLSSSSSTTSSQETFHYLGTAVDLAHDISEDMRYVVQVPLNFDPLLATLAGANLLAENNLKNETGLVYAIRLTIRLKSGQEIVYPSATDAAPLLFQAVPCAPPNNNRPSISFVGGGDYNIRGGEERIKSALVQYPNASFVYLGGDLAYANNMRRCYRRWDDFFLQLDKVARSSVNSNAKLPLLTAVGNHEGGGYLLAENSKEQRRKRFRFYSTYFPYQSQTIPFTNTAYSAAATATASSGNFQDYRVLNHRTSISSPSSSYYYESTIPEGSLASELSDDTLTFHDHSVAGGAIHFIVLDSEVMVAAREQTQFLNKSLASVAAAADNSSSSPYPTTVIPIYHNPAYPARRKMDEITEEVRSHFLPLLESHKDLIPVVLEHHDHVYKRTYPIINGAVTNTSAATAHLNRADGLRFIGDGALGAWSEKHSPDTSRSYLAASSAANYYVSVELTLGGETVVKAYTGTSESEPTLPFDEIRVNP